MQIPTKIKLLHTQTAVYHLTLHQPKKNKIQHESRPL
jgi:hypothetical protein